MSAVIEIWRANLDELAVQRADLIENLDARENARAARFAKPLDGSRFRVGRGYLRERLAPHLSCAARQIAIEYGAWGKPFAPDFPDWQWSVSHSGPVLIIAIARGRAIGVDIERVRPNAVISHALAPAERAENDAQFLQLWTLKEAFLKARGDGWSIAPADIDASHWRRGCCVRDARSGAWNRCEDWQLRPLSIFAGCVGAIAFEKIGVAPSILVRQ